MITLPEYHVMGEDGQEYGPVSAEQIRAWYQDQRLERKSPIKPSGGKDWVFLESLPEFAALFQPPHPPVKSHRGKWRWIAACALVLAGLVFLALKIQKHP